MPHTEDARLAEPATRATHHPRSRSLQWSFRLLAVTVVPLFVLGLLEIGLPWRVSDIQLASVFGDS